MMILNGNLAKRITNKDNYHPKGRWKSVTIGPKDQQIVIYTACIVNYTSLDSTKNKTDAYDGMKCQTQKSYKYTNAR